MTFRAIVQYYIHNRFPLHYEVIKLFRQTDIKFYVNVVRTTKNTYTHRPRVFLTLSTTIQEVIYIWL